MKKQKKIIEELENLEKIENSLDVEHLDKVRDLINKAPEGAKKEELQDRLNALMPNIKLELKNATANLDLYIKSENMLLLALDTNNITFEDFSGVDDMEKSGAINISINSSLPYQLNAYLVTEIQNSDKTNTMDNDVLNIKESSETDYQNFENINEKIVLKDNCDAGNDKTHTVDMMLKGGNAYEANIYKTVIKFEAEQK